MAKPRDARTPALQVSTEVARQIRQHARSNRTTEVCGVLIGTETDGQTTINACIAGANAAQGGAHVTFTQDTWEHIYKMKDRDYPDGRIVGWYHSHPGFGVFLSDHDTFIHENFFSSPNQVAWVFDPHSDEEGCFGWRNGRLERVPQFGFIDGRGGESANAASHTKPIATDDIDDEMNQRPSQKSDSLQDQDKDVELSNLSKVVSNVFSHLAFLVLGGLLVWYLLPRILVMPVPVDPKTGQPIGGMAVAPLSDPRGAPSTMGSQQPSAPASRTNPTERRSGDGH
jgi:proteasome lid subunit RPN8/RPN11